MYLRLIAYTLVLLAGLMVSPSYAANREIQELQRELAQLSEQLKQVQQSQDRQFGEIREMVQQSLKAATDAGRAVTVIQNGIQQNLRDQESKVVAPVLGLSTRLEQVSNDTRGLQQAVGELTSLISRMQTQMTDLSNAVKVLAAPPPPPPPSSTEPGGGSAAAPPPDTPTISATDLYNNAMRDRQGGKLDLAAQQFADYLRWYGNTELAPNAQFYMAWIHQQQQDYDTAVREYDMVLEKYPDNNKTPDALYGKGTSLVKLGRRTDGAREFQELIKRFPSHALTSQACSQLTAVGYRCNVAPSASSRPVGKRK